MWREETLEDIWIKFCVQVGIRNIVKCTKFSDDGLRDWVWGGVKFHHSSQAWGWVFVLKNLVYHMSTGILKLLSQS